MKIAAKTAVLSLPTKVMDLVEEMAQLPILFQDQIMRDLKNLKNKTGCAKFLIKNLLEDIIKNSWGWTPSRYRAFYSREGPK